MPSRHAMHIIDHALTDQKRLVYAAVVQCPFWLLSSLHSSKRKMLKLAEHNEPDDFSVRLLVVSTSIRLIKFGPKHEKIQNGRYLSAVLCQ